MKITREKLLQDAFVLFMQHNYEKVSYTMLTRAIGLSKAGMSYYYRTKQELFMAVVDRYVFNVHDADAKFTPAATFAEFLDNFLENVRSRCTDTSFLATLSDKLATCRGGGNRERRAQA